VNDGVPSGPRDLDVVLDVRGLRTSFLSDRGEVKAVDGVSFQLRRGETLGIVGESGCGKTVTALSIMRLLPRQSARTVGGEIWLGGRDLLTLSPREMRRVRGRQISMILQDPQTSLNPVFTVGNQVVEALETAHEGGTPELRQRAVGLLHDVNIAAPERRMRNYPHQLSGGMKQRVVGAIAIAGGPEVVIADEPTTALDVTIQLQYLRLLRDIQRRTNLSIIFITHDFGIIARMCDRVAVMYAGRIVEQGEIRDIFNSPSHPYTEALIKSVPKVEQRADRLPFIEGQPPGLGNWPAGCAFAERCVHRGEKCREHEYPPTVSLRPGHAVDCWRYLP